MLCSFKKKSYWVTSCANLEPKVQHFRHLLCLHHQGIMPKKISPLLITDLKEIFVVLWETELREKLVKMRQAHHKIVLTNVTKQNAFHPVTR
jgi:hypothetical protein